MKMNKKGFTLIELLAVIVILAIIALIATPIVMNLITKARKSAAQDSAYGLVKAAETHYAEALLDNQGEGFPTTVFTCEKVDGANVCKTTAAAGETAVELKFNGTKPSAGTVTINSDGEVSLDGIIINTYACEKAADGTITCDTPKKSGE